MLAAALAIAVTGCCGFLFIIQFYSVLKNQTAIESYICDKADDMTRSEDSSFVYPYDLGYWNNFKCFLFAGNGIDWPIKPGCSKYALTVEQKLQKEAKRERSVEFEAVQDYSGAMCPITLGFEPVYGVPINDEPRMKLDRGDVIVVTRGKTHWLYGQKRASPRANGIRVKERGWFPRKCVQHSAQKSLLKKIFNSSKKDI